MTEFNSCDRCDNGYHYRITKSGYKIATKCSCRLNWEYKVKMEIKGQRAHLRPSMYAPKDGQYYNPVRDYRGLKSLNSMTKVTKYARNYKDKFSGQSLYLYGPHSTQKTTIAQWVALTLMEEDGFNAEYILMKDLVDLLTREGWEDKKDKTPSIANYNLESIKRSDLLIIDESFDKNKITIYKSSYQIPYLDQFLRHRIDVMEKSTIFISNIAPELMTRDFPSLNDLSHLIDRKITKKGAALSFTDNYNDVENDFEPEDIFA